MRGTMSGIKPENSFSALSPLSPTVGCFAPHSHPSPPEEKAASRKKSRLRRKKTAPTANSWASCVSRVAYSYLWGFATTDPPRLMALAAAGSKRRFRLRLRLHGVVHDMPSPMADLPPRCPTFCSFPYHPEAYHPAPYRHINRLLSKEPCKKNATLQKSGVRYFSA